MKKSNILGLFVTAVALAGLAFHISEARLIGVNPTGANADIVCDGGRVVNGQVVAATELCQDYQGNFEPTTSGTQSLGTATLYFSNVYSSASTISGNTHVTGGSTIGGQLTVVGTTTLQGNAFSVGGSSIVLSSGKTGIGTSSPGTTLDVNGDATIRGQLTVAGSSLTVVSATPQLYLHDTASNGGYTKIQTDNNTAFFGINDSAGSNFGGTGYAGIIYSAGPYPFQIYTNSAERMRITSAGNVGIGTGAPSLASSQLQVGSGALYFAVKTNGWVETHMAPSPNVGTCGTSPSVASGNDMAGDVTMGIGNTQSCAITFTSVPSNTPSCFCTDKTTKLSCIAQATTSGITMTPSASTSFAINDELHWGCLGWQ